MVFLAFTVRSVFLQGILFVLGIVPRAIWNFIFIFKGLPLTSKQIYPFQTLVYFTVHSQWFSWIEIGVVFKFSLPKGRIGLRNSVARFTFIRIFDRGAFVSFPITWFPTFLNFSPVMKQRFFSPIQLVCSILIFTCLQVFSTH